ncbi:glutamine dumper 1 [Actinidia rufa]|uniref:Glutamine dumper 1 n=1 Tax=Actinidia rufa TaxID=165716 RepID=A0A7J0E3A9_9ERIC|nr:glutamine dumper 1 [Actinidia rufa]
MISTGAPHAATAPLVERSLWHSPVSYLFCGLAAMLGLIAFALLVLAFSYRKPPATSTVARTVAPPTETSSSELIFEEKLLVIMAGEAKPKFLATLVSSQNSSLGSKFSGGGSNGGRTEKVEEGSGDQVRKGY